MTIFSARFASPDGAVVTAMTNEGELLIPLVGPDVSGGWREVYMAWEGLTEPYEPLSTREAPEAFMERNGYRLFDLIDLMDIEGKLALASLDKPPKAAAVRDWIDHSRIALATDQPAQPAPYTYQEVTAEVLPLIP